MNKEEFISKEQAWEIINNGPLDNDNIQKLRNYIRFGGRKKINIQDATKPSIETLIENVERSGYFFEWESVDSNGNYEEGIHKLVDDGWWLDLKQHISQQEQRIKELEEYYEDKTFTKVANGWLKERNRLKSKLDRISEVVENMKNSEYADCESVYEEYINIQSILKESE